MKANMENFQAKFAQLSNNKKTIFVFKGDIDPNTGINWCSDCVQAETSIKQYLQPLAEKFNIPLLYVDVGIKEQWKNQNHELRQSTIFKLKGVPTICWLENGSVSKKLVEEECWNQELIETLFEDEEDSKN